jgi:hypothetical protein
MIVAIRQNVIAVFSSVECCKHQLVLLNSKLFMLHWGTSPELADQLNAPPVTSLFGFMQARGFRLLERNDLQQCLNNKLCFLKCWLCNMLCSAGTGVQAAGAK